MPQVYYNAVDQWKRNEQDNEMTLQLNIEGLRLFFLRLFFLRLFFLTVVSIFLLLGIVSQTKGCNKHLNGES